MACKREEALTGGCIPDVRNIGFLGSRHDACPIGAERHHAGSAVAYEQIQLQLTGRRIPDSDVSIAIVSHIGIGDDARAIRTPADPFTRSRLVENPDDSPGYDLPDPNG